MENIFEDEVLPIRKTVVVKPKKIMVNPQYSTSKVNNFLQTMV